MENSDHNAAQPNSTHHSPLVDLRHNAAMPKRFQFSIGQMLFAVVCFSFAALAFSAFLSHTEDPTRPWILVLPPACTLVGAGIGAFAGDIPKGAVWGLVGTIFVLLICVMYSIYRS
jgi:hypothetical protein